MPARDNSSAKAIDGTSRQNSAWTLFRALVSQNDPARMAARHILAMMLERKGLLRRKTLTMDAGRRVEIYEDTTNGEVFRITDPELQLDQVDAVQREIADLLENGLPPAQAESVGSSESRPAAGRRRGVSECKPLLDAATKDLFRKNAFRITGLSVDATARERDRHANKLTQLVELKQDPHTQNAAFSMKPPPSLDEIREAIGNLKDSEKRLIDEFFWFWPSEFGTTTPDPALEALASGNADAALNIWTENETNPSSGMVAMHNIALFWQLRALDLESDNADPEADRAQEQTVEKYWRNSLKRWKYLASDDHLWDKVAARVRQTADPRLTSGFVRRMRATLPLALAKINAELALAHAKNGRMPLAKMHVQLLREGNEGLANLEKAAELVLTPARNRLKEQIKRAQERAKSNPQDAASAARELLQQAQSALPLYDLFFGKDSDLRNDLFEEVASVCNRLQIAYYKATGDDRTCLEILKLVLPFATSTDLRQSIEKDISETCARLEQEGYTTQRTAAQSNLEILKQHKGFLVLAGIIIIVVISNLKSCDSPTSYNPTPPSPAPNPPTYTPPQSSISPQKDSAPKTFPWEDFPKSSPLDEIVLSGISGTGNHRLAVINDRTLAAGETAVVKVGGQWVTLRCVEIREKSALVHIDGLEGEQEIYFKQSSATRGNRTYSVPSFVSSTLNSEKAEIETERANLEAFETQIEQLGSEIDRERLYLDRESQFAVDEFNAKVAQYNALAQKAKIVNAAFNKKVDNYNAKLRQSGR